MAKKQNRTAGQAFAEHSAHVDAQLKLITARVEAARAEFEKDPGNWGLVGNMNHVSDELAGLIEFLMPTE